MQNPIANKKIWVWLVILLTVLLFSRYILIQGQLKEYPMYASDSPSPTGVKAFYTYALNHQDVVKRWSDSPSQLPNKPANQLLIMIEPYFTPNSAELDSYNRFMEAGNTILLFKENPKGMFGLETEVVETDAVNAFDPAGANYRTKTDVTSQVRLLENAQDEILLSDDAGTIALKRVVGEGQLIVTNSPKWIMNGEIVTDDHLALILALLKDVDSKVILFDEYIHDVKNATTILNIYPRWFLLLMIQGALLTILWLWHHGKRFGPIFISRQETVRFSDEGIKALAAWYIRGHRYHDSLVIQANYVMTLLQEHWRIPYHQEWKDLTAQFERKLPHLEKGEIHSLLNGLADMLEKSTVSKQEYLLWSKRLEKIRKEVEEG